jgi:cytochrome c553
MTFRIRLIALAALHLAAAAAFAQEPPKGSAVRGHELFTQLGCYFCHGTAGEGGERGAGPKLFPNPFPLEAFSMQLRKPRRDMPQYVEKWVSDQDVADLHAYLTSLKPAPAAKDIPQLKDF